MTKQAQNILLGVTGGIAAYKSAFLVRLLKQAGFDVRVVMTKAAQAFVTPLTFQALSGYPVATDLLDPEAEAGMGHIELARWADAILVAPATADFMAKTAHGLADDLLGNIILASPAPLYMAPAMNQQMWKNLATQQNAETLRARGITLLGPDSGEQACGDTGAGRMMEPEQISRILQNTFSSDALAVSDASAALSTEVVASPSVLQGRTVVITAGPTQEAIDPVRYISNHSSGKMGYALAQACTEAGATVTLVSGPTALPAPEVNQLIKVTTAEDMMQAVMAQMQQPCDIFIATAAVADYKISDPADKKIKKTADAMTISLVKNPDILATVANLENAPFTVGFAAETDRHNDHARQKLERKKLDMLALNDVADPTIGFKSDENILHVYFADNYNRPVQTLGRADKAAIARQLVQLIAQTVGEKSLLLG